MTAAHKEGSAVLGAYTQQAEYLDERRSMMHHWADHLDEWRSCLCTFSCLDGDDAEPYWRPGSIYLKNAAATGRRRCLGEGVHHHLMSDQNHRLAIDGQAGEKRSQGVESRLAIVWPSKKGIQRRQGLYRPKVQ
ncbi:hypothetical protein [Candidatus Accumulibacter sp. ACC007]|uniref:hypothetical protein n=1 Tax=Candidatus Accumulibacter sp. ACC007 TaxID=2823333 RepID=UPI0025C0D12B|nr:hypothetical protein [Candidatus Accumulibacter sp. ACC007]